MISLFTERSVIHSSVMYALHMWVNSLIPALFPFFIITDILINYNIIDYIPRIIKELCKKIFCINDNMLTILFLSMISGFPSNARMTHDLYKMGSINLREANHMLVFTHFANPLFIYSTICIFFLHNKKVGLIILMSHYISNMILGIIIRKYSKYDINDNVNNGTIKKHFGSIFITALRKAIDTITLICGIVCIFLILAMLIVKIGHFNSYTSIIIKGFFEITIGVEALGRSQLSLIYKAVMASCFLAFGGLSVHVQVLSQIVDTEIKYIYFLIGRLWQMIISGIITFVICIILGI